MEFRPRARRRTGGLLLLGIRAGVGAHSGGFCAGRQSFLSKPPPTYVVSPAGVRMKTGSAINTARARFIDQIHEQSFPLLKILPGAINEAASPFDVPWQRKCPLPGVAMGKPTGQGHERRPALSSRGFFHFCRQKMRRSIGRPPVGAGNRWAGNPTLLRTISFRRHRVKMATCLRH